MCHGLITKKWINENKPFNRCKKKIEIRHSDTNLWGKNLTHMLLVVNKAHDSKNSIFPPMTLKDQKSGAYSFTINAADKTFHTDHGSSQEFTADHIEQHKISNQQPT